MRTMFSRIIWVILFSLWALPACQPEAATTPPAPTLPPTFTPAPTQTATPAPTETPLPTQTHTATIVPDTSTPTATLWPTQTPTSSPTPGPTPLPFPDQPLDPGSAAGLTLLAEWGRGAVRDVQSLASGSTLLVRTDFGISLFNAKTYQELRYQPAVTHHVISPDTRFVVLALVSGEVIVWDGASGATWREAAYPGVKTGDLEKQVVSLAISDDSQQIAAAYGDKTVLVFPPQGEQSTYITEMILPWPENLLFSPDHSRLIVYTSYGDFGVWDLLNNKLALVLTAIGSIPPNPFSADRTLVATNDLLVYELTTGNLVYQLSTGGTYKFYRFAPDGRHAVLENIREPGVFQIRQLWDNRIRTQEQTGFTTEELFPFIPLTAFDKASLVQHGFVFGELSHAGFNETGELLGKGIDNDRVYTWNVFEGSRTELPPIAWPDGPFGSFPAPVYFSDEGSTAVFCAQEGLIAADMTALTGQVVERCSPWEPYAVSPDGQFAARSRLNKGYIYQRPDWALSNNLLGMLYPPDVLRYATSGRYITASGGCGGQPCQVLVYQLEPTPRKAGEFSFETFGVFTHNVSPDGTILAVSASFGLQLYRLNGETTYYYRNESLYPHLLAFNAAGDLLAAAASNSLIVLSIPDGDTVFSQPVGESSITSVRFIKNDTALLLTYADGTIAMWGVP